MCQREYWTQLLESLLYPDIPFDDLAIDTCTFYLFDSLLYKRVIADTNGEVECSPFPVAITVIIQVLGVCVAGKCIAASAGVEMVRGVFRAVPVML